MSDYDSDRTETAPEEDGPDDDFYMSDLLTQQIHNPRIEVDVGSDEEKEESNNENMIEVEDIQKNNTIWFPNSNSNDAFESTESSDQITMNPSKDLEENNEASIWKPTSSDETHVFTNTNTINFNEEMNKKNQVDPFIFEMEEENEFYTGETRSLPRISSHTVSQSAEKSRSIQTESAEKSSTQGNDEGQNQLSLDPKCDLEHMFDSEKDNMGLNSPINKAGEKLHVDDVNQIGDDKEQENDILCSLSNRSEKLGANHASEIEDKTLVIELEPSQNKDTHSSYELSKPTQENHEKQNDDEEISEKVSPILLKTTEDTTDVESPVISASADNQEKKSSDVQNTEQVEKNQDETVTEMPEEIQTSIPTNGAIGINDLENESQNKNSRNKEEKTTSITQQEQKLPSPQEHINSKNKDETNIIDEAQDPNSENNGVNEKVENTKEATCKDHNNKGELENEGENTNEGDKIPKSANYATEEKDENKHVINEDSKESPKGKEVISKEALENKESNSLISNKLDADGKNHNAIEEINDKNEENNTDDANHNKVLFSETPTIICTLSLTEDPDNRCHTFDQQSIAVDDNLEKPEKKTNEIDAVPDKNCNDNTEKHDDHIVDKPEDGPPTDDTSMSHEKRVDFVLDDNLSHSQTAKEFTESPILLRHDNVSFDPSMPKPKVSDTTPNTKKSLKITPNTNKHSTQVSSGKSNRKASAWITPNKNFESGNDLSRLLLPGQKFRDDSDEEQEFEFTDNTHDEHNLASPEISGINFSKPDISQEPVLQNTQEDDVDLSKRSQNVLSRLRRGISSQNESFSQDESAKPHNEKHEVGIENDDDEVDDENIDDAIISLINKYEQRLTEYEEKIQTLEHKLARSQDTIKEKDKEIISLKQNQKSVQSHIANAEQKLSKRKLSLPSNVPLTVDNSKKSKLVVDNHLSVEESDLDNTSVSSSDASEEENVHETVSFSSSEREPSSHSFDEEEEIGEEDWDDYLLMEQSNYRLTFKSYKSIVKITKEFLSESQAFSYMSLLWKPIWNVLKSQGENSTMRWDYGKNPSKLDLGPNWIFLPPKSGRKKVKGIDYFEQPDDVLREIFFCIKLIDVHAITDGELSELGNLCSLDFQSRKTRSNDSLGVSSRRPASSSPSRRNRSKPKSKCPKSINNAKRLRDSETPKKDRNLDRATSATKRKRSPSKSSSKEKPAKQFQVNKKVRQIEQTTKEVRLEDDGKVSEPESNDDSRNANDHSQKTLAGADMLLALTNANVNNTSSAVQKQSHIQPSSEHGVDDDTHVLLKEGLFGIGDFDQILDSKDIATVSGINKLSNMRNETRNSRQQSTKDKQTPIKSNKAQIITPMKSSPISNVKILPHLSQSPDSPLSYATSSTSKNNKTSLLDKYFFFVSGVEKSVTQSITNLGGTVVSDMQKLSKLSYRKKLFFLSEPSSRKKFKYILAAALGVPMLHFSWISEQEQRYNLNKSGVSIYDGALYSKSRLPTGLSLNSGVYKLQRASDAKHWKQPIDSSGKPILDGMYFSVICERRDVEKDWELILTTLGATIKDKRDRSDDQSRVLDAIIVDSLDLPPYSKAPPSRLSSFLNRIENSDSPIPLIDFSWVVQSITNRRRLSFDSDPRFLIDFLRRDHGHLYSIKINNVRYDVGDYVKIKTRSESSFARIDCIKPNMGQRHGYSLGIRCLVQEGTNRLVDPGKCGLNLTIDESDIESHVIIVSSSDYELIKDGYGRDSSVFMLKIK